MDDVVASFRPVQDSFVNFRDESDNSRFSLRDCWMALSEARLQGWIDLSNKIRPHMDCLDYGIFDIDAYAHYAKMANGSMFPVVPGKIVMFPSPVDLPADVEWIDSADGKHRHFSAAYYAELLKCDFNVSVVACVDSGKDDWPAFAEHGLAVEPLPLDGSCPGLLRALDRLLALTQGGGGSVALHSGADAAGWRAGALVAAYLVRRLGFPPDAAIAWIRMVDRSLLLGRSDSDCDALGWADPDPLTRSASFSYPKPRAAAETAAAPAVSPAPTRTVAAPRGTGRRLRRAASWASVPAAVPALVGGPRRGSLEE